MEFIIGGIIGLIVIITLGYYLYSYAEENYGYNVFNIWIILRGVGSFVVLYLAVVSEGNVILLILSAGLLVWNFFSTWRNTSLIIAILAFVLQLIASLFAFEILNRVYKSFKGEY